MLMPQANILCWSKLSFYVICMIRRIIQIYTHNIFWALYIHVITLVNDAYISMQQNISIVLSDIHSECYRQLWIFQPFILVLWLNSVHRSGSGVLSKPSRPALPIGGRGCSSWIMHPAPFCIAGVVIATDGVWYTPNYEGYHGTSHLARLIAGGVRKSYQGRHLGSAGGKASADTQGPLERKSN